MKHYYLLLLSFLCFLPAAAQEVKVISMTETIDIIPAAEQKRDLNKNLAALVKIQVVDEITEIEGNILGDIVIHGVEKWVYMAKGSKNMKIHFKNHLPIRLKFQDYQINALASNRVYELVIDAPNAPAAGITSTDQKGNNLQLRVTPPYATVTIWSDEKPRQVYRPQNDGMISIFLPYGRYYYQATATGYEPTEGTVFVNDEQSITNIDLSVIMGTLSIDCPTEKADFYLNGIRLDKDAKATRWTGKVAPASYTVVVKRKGFVEQSKTVDVIAKTNTTAQIPALMTEAEQKKAESAQKREQAKAAAQAKAASLAQAKSQQKAEEARQKAQKAQEQKELKAKKAKEQEALKAKKAKEQAELQKKKAAERKINAEARAQKLAIKEKQPVVIGVTAGYNMATAQFSGDGDTKAVSGFHVGLTAEFRLSNSFYLNTGALFSSKGYKYSSNKEIDEKGTAQYIDIPLLASLRFPAGKTAKFQVNAGPYVALCAGGKVSDEWRYSKLYDEKFSSAYSSFDYGIQAGIGVDIVYHIHCGVSYQFGMEKKYPNRNLMISVGYRF